jgi:8-oxo-dGTP diphosphatase
MQTKNINAHLTEIQDYFNMAVSVDCVIFGFDNDELKVLLIKSDLNEFKDRWSLLGDVVHPDEELDQAAYRVLKTRTGLDQVFMEQVQTFGGVHRHPAGRVITVAYYSLVNIEQNVLKKHGNELHWHTLKKVQDLAFDHKEILQCCYERLKHKVIAQKILSPRTAKPLRSHIGCETGPAQLPQEIPLHGPADRPERRRG